MSALTSFFAPKVGHPVLFRDLCQVHELDKKTTKLLTQITQELIPEQQGMVFIDPEILKKAVGMSEYADSVDLIRELYYKWFGGAI